MRINKLINLASAGVSSELQFSGDDAPFLSRKRMLVERLSTQRSEAHDKTHLYPTRSLSGSGQRSNPCALN